MNGTGMKLTFMILLVVSLFSAGLVEAQQQSPEPLVQQALDTNPGLKSLDLQVQALQHKAQAVQKWMDPVFAVEYSNFPWDSWSLGDSPMTGVQFKLQQTFTLAGKNDRREATALAESDAAKWMLEEKRNQLAGLVRHSYWSLALVRQLKTITEKYIALVGQLVEVVRAKYQVGNVGQHDLMRLELLQDKLKDDLKDFDLKEREILAAINAAVHREPTVAISTPEVFVQIPSSQRSLDQWVEQAKKNRPLLQALPSEARAKRLAADQAAYEKWPDITLWAGYRIRQQVGNKDDGTDQMALGIAIPIPFNYTGSSDAQKEMNLAQASAKDEEAVLALDNIRGALESALAGWERASQKAALYAGSLIPDTQKTLDSTLSAYQSDRADFQSLYQMELQLLEFERALRSAQAQALIQRSAVHTIAGADTQSATQ